jgi:hypothetical protein
MLVRQTLIRNIDYSIQKVNELKKYVNRWTDEELNEILIGSFVEFGANILNNLEFQRLILSRHFDDENAKCQKPMSNEELSEYFYENWDLLVDVDSIVIDPNLFLT